MALHLSGQNIDSRQYNTTVEFDELFELASDWMASAQTGKEVEITTQIMNRFMPLEYFANHTPNCITAKKIGERWLAIYWGAHNVGRQFTEGFVFGWKESNDPGRSYVPIMPQDPGKIKFSNTGDLTIEHQGQQLFFKADSPGWPDAIAAPEDYLALGMLNYLLKPGGDDNALSALLKETSSSVRFTAKSLADHLREIQRALEKQVPPTK